MKNKLGFVLLIIVFLTTTIFSQQFQRRDSNSQLGQRRDSNSIQRYASDLVKQAEDLALNSYDHFKGRNGEISDQEQAILFKSEAFTASCRLFLRFCEDNSDFYNRDYRRTNLYNAFMYLTSSFRELEQEMRRGNIMPYALTDCRRILDILDREFSGGRSVDNLSYLHQKYVKGNNNTVYMIERKDTGRYILHPFKNLSSLYRYNLDQKRGDDPWKNLEKVPESTLEKMEEGNPIDADFEGSLVMDKNNRPNQTVYLIRNGRKCPIASPQVLNRYGGWDKVIKLPAEVINDFPDGKSIE